jgi:hypothetical protein
MLSAPAWPSHLRDLDALSYDEYLASAHWSRLKHDVHQRSGGFCERCRVNRGSMVHHLAYPRSRYATTPRHLRHVCTQCHRVVHGLGGHIEDPLLEPAALLLAPPSVPEPRRAPELEPICRRFATPSAEDAMGTLLARLGIAQATARRLGVGFAATGTWPGTPAPMGRVVFPQHDRSGHLVGMAGLAIDPWGAIGHSDIVGPDTGYLGATRLRGGATVAICRHPLDALLLEDAGAAAVAVFDLRAWRPAWAVSLAGALLVADVDAPETGSGSAAVASSRGTGCASPTCPASAAAALRPFAWQSVLRGS